MPGERPRPRNGTASLLRYAPTILAACAGLVFSVAVAFVVAQLGAKVRELEFIDRAGTAVSMVRARAQANLEIVRSIVAFYNSSVSVTRDEFRSFTAPFLSAETGIRALEWVPAVSHSDRLAFEERARQEGHGAFQITERSAEDHAVSAASRAEYFPVLYVEPVGGNAEALGYDLASDPTRLLALTAARDTGMIQATAPITLVQEEAGARSVLVAAPVYGGGRGPYRDELEQRRATLTGFAVAVLRVADLVDVALSETSAAHRRRAGGMGIYVYDDDVSGHERLIAFYSTADPHGFSVARDERAVLSATHVLDTFEFANRTWTIVATPVAAAAAWQAAWESRAAFLVGLACTVALAAYLLLNAHRTYGVERLVEQRTAELEASNDLLERRIADFNAAEAALQERSKLARYLSPQVFTSISTGQHPIEIASQRKKLTVFFCDIAGFTKAVDRLESEEVTEILNRYLTEMTRIALHFGATIDKYMGDGIMLFFGDPESGGVKEDALACVRMAIAMRTRMGELAPMFEPLGVEVPLQCRMGVSTGYCTVGNFGSEERMDYTIIGHGVILAARLEAAAPPGSILISHETYMLVRDGICCEERPRLEVKGFSSSEANYQVIDSWENIHENDGVIREEHASMKLDVDLRKMSAMEREHAEAVLERALTRLRARGGAG